MPRKKPPFLHRVWRAVRYAYYRIVRSNAMPGTTAMGLAVGVFIGFLPIVPLQTIVAVALAIPFRGGKISAAVGTWISNPLTYVPLFYPINYYVGCFVFPSLNAAGFDQAFFHRLVQLEVKDIVNAFSTAGFRGFADFFVALTSGAGSAFAAMLLGGVVLGIPGAFLTYLLALRIIRRYHALRAERIRRRGKSPWV